jgi:Leucine-rich repeat (LRR) protein
MSLINSRVSVLNLENLPALEELEVRASDGVYGVETQLELRDISKNSALTYLECSNHKLTALDVSNKTALKYLYCSNNKLTVFDVSKNNNTALIDLDCSYNKLTALDVSNKTALTRLNCSDNLLTTLNVSKNTVLGDLYCSRNKLDAAALNALFKDLPSSDGIGCYPPTDAVAINALLKSLPNCPPIVYVSDNPGSNTCDRTIATNKGWRVN